MKLMHIKSNGKRFCRAGIEFTEIEQTFEEGDLTQAQVKILEKEPKISIRYEILPENLPPETLPQGDPEPKEPKKVRLDKDPKK